MVSDAMRSVITAPMTKGVAGAAGTADIPARFAGFCRPCVSVHAREVLFRLAVLPTAVGQGKPVGPARARSGPAL